MIRQSAYDRIVTAFHRAAFDDGHWPAATKLVDESCNMRCSHVAVVRDGEVVVETDSAFGRVYCRGEIWEEPEREYLENYWAIDVRAPRALALPYGRMVAGRDLLTAEERKESPIYNEFHPKYDAGEQVVTRLDVGPGLDVLWVLTKSREQGDWAPTEVRLLERLQPHLAHAVAVRQALFDARLLDATFDGMLAGRAAGVLYLDDDGFIVDANAAADRIMRSREGLAHRYGKPRALHPEDDLKLGRLLNAALPRDTGRAPRGGSVAIRRQSGQPPLAVHVQPLNRAGATLGARTLAALMLIVDPALSQ